MTGGLGDWETGRLRDWGKGRKGEREKGRKGEGEISTPLCGGLIDRSQFHINLNIWCIVCLGVKM